MFDDIHFQVLSGYKLPKNYYSTSNQLMLVFTSDACCEGTNGLFYLSYEALNQGKLGSMEWFVA